MNKILIVLVVCSLLSCKEKTETQAKTASTTYPNTMSAIFDHHGGLDQWYKMKSFSFELDKDVQNERHQIDLNSRKERIEGAFFRTGFDGDKIWLEADTSVYKGNPVFYHNLMFYFVAMPFVLGDDGIIYSKTEALTFEGVSYPGVKISYGSDIGFSPEDEYFIHYDATTERMEWLGYTVTYFSGEKTKDVHWIRYEDWKNTNGLLLPSSLSWYKYAAGLPTEFRNKVEVLNMDVNEDELDQSHFNKTSKAEFIEN